MFKIGYGRDIHAIKESGRELILGGIKIPFEKRIDAHSDGDVLFHAVAEALYGSLGMGDLGTYFPENDDKYDAFDSSLIVKHALESMKERGYHLVNVDISLICEKPKLRPYISLIKNNLKSILNLEDDCVSVKAQTNEKIDDIGALKAIECICALLIEKD